MNVVVDVVVPSAVATDTFTLPGGCASVRALIVVELVTVKLTAVVEPNLTPVVLVRLVPVMVTLAPPVVEPDRGSDAGNGGQRLERECLAGCGRSYSGGYRDIYCARYVSLGHGLDAGGTCDVKLAAVVEPNLTAEVPVRLVP